MFRQIRRSDRAISETDAAQILSNGQYGILSTVSADGSAYGIPVDYVCLDNSIYFHSAVEGHKLDNIAENPKVSFCVVGHTRVLPEKFATEYESVVVFGEASEVVGDEKLTALLELIKKYSPEHIEGGKEYIARAHDKTKVIRIRIERMTGKARR